MARVTDLTTAIGRVIAEQRKVVGLSQEALAFASGLHRTYISLVERGINVPTVTTLYDLARPLQVPPSELLRRVEAVVPPITTEALPPVHGRVSGDMKTGIDDERLSEQ